MRNTTARAFSVVASALGIPALLPFLKAVCQSECFFLGCVCVCEWWVVWAGGVRSECLFLGVCVCECE